jgi:hypothetical protein
MWQNVFTKFGDFCNLKKNILLLLLLLLSFWQIFTLKKRLPNIGIN